MLARERTANPKLWNVYWGFHRSDDMLIDNQIIRNRNLAETNLGLLKVMKIPCDLAEPMNLPSPEDWDHLEVYKCIGDARCVFFSSYNRDYVTPLAEKAWFRKYIPLYTNTAWTYAAWFHDRMEMRKVLKSVLGMR